MIEEIEVVVMEVEVDEVWFAVSREMAENRGSAAGNDYVAGDQRSKNKGCIWSQKGGHGEGKLCRQLGGYRRQKKFERWRRHENHGIKCLFQRPMRWRRH